jgi:diacylglycerol kinase family enzyme
MMTMTDRLTPRHPLPVLVNAFAGAGGARAADAVRRAFREAGVAAEVAVVQPGHLAQRVRAAVEAGAPIVAVAGGDGTMRTAAAQLAGGTSALLPIPTGSLNTFARGVGIRGMRAAARALAYGTIERVAVGTVEDRVFLNTATVGAYARILRLRELLRRPLGRELATLAAAWSVLRESASFQASLQVGDERIGGALRLVWTGLGRGPLGLPGGLSARRAAAELEVAVLPADGWGGARMPPVIQRRCQAFTVDAPHRLDLTLDGDPVGMDPPVRVAVWRAALSVVCLPEPSRRRDRRESARVEGG